MELKPSLLERIYRSERAIHVTGWATIIVGAAYLAWFVGWALRYDLWWFSIPLALANTQGYISILSYLFSSWYQTPAPLPVAPAVGTCDVFIPTLDEPFEILAPSVLAAVAIEYPHRTYVLDDGRREWVRDLCLASGATWITRPDNLHAKAGNLNHALSKTTGEFIVTLDADFIVSPRMASDLLGHFAEPRVALVQCPQVFYNTDSFQHFDDGTDWNEQSLFHDVIMPAKNHWNAVYWCGSPAIIRRAALEAIGGVATTSVTEDIETSVLLHRTGWRTLFDTRILARGVAPEDYQRFYRQRLRWTSGGLQLLRTQLWRPGFTLGQRLSYWSSAGLTFSALRAATLYFVPALVLISGQFPVRSNGFAITVVVLMPTTTLFANIVFGRRVYRIIRNELYGFIGLAAYLTAYPVLLGMPAGFGVTQKGRISESRRFPPSLYLLVFFIGLYIVAIVIGHLRIAGALPAPDHPRAASSVEIWAILMMAVFAFALGFALRHGRSAWRGYRGLWPATARVSDGDAQPAEVVRLGMGRLEVSLAGQLPALGDAVDVELSGTGIALTGVVSAPGRDGIVRIEILDPPLELARFLAELLFPPGPPQTTAPSAPKPSITTATP